eukprot:3021578-Rhodomonas_salina.1
MHTTQKRLKKRGGKEGQRGGKEEKRKKKKTAPEQSVGVHPERPTPRTRAPPRCDGHRTAPPISVLLQLKSGSRQRAAVC